MLKKMMVFMMSVCLVASSVGSVFANELNRGVFSDGSIYVVDNIKDFKAEINSIDDIDKLSEKEKNQILAKVDPDVLEEFVDEKIQILQNKMNKITITNTTTKEEIDLGDNCKAIVSAIDEEDNALQSIRGMRRSTPGAETLWKGFGNRQFTVKYELKMAVLNADLILVNHYTLSKNGISVRYGEAEVGNPSFIGLNFGSVDPGVVVTNSDKATKKGKSVKISCIYKFTYQTLYGAEITKRFKLYNEVKYSDIDLTEKEVKVVQSWSGDWM